MKAWSKRIGTFFMGTALLISMALPAGAAVNEITVGTKTVTATGEASVRVKPDTAYITLGFRTKGKDAIKVANASSAKMKKITAAVIAAGAKKDDVQTSGMSIYESYDYDYSPEKSTTGENPPSYQVENTVNITLHDIDKLADVVNSAFKAGANYINNVSFDVTEQGESYDEMLTKATKAAMSRVKLLAAASDQQIDKVVNVSEVNDGVYNTYDRYGSYYSVDLSSINNAKEQANAAIGLGNELRTGTILIQAQVSVTYSIK